MTPSIHIGTAGWSIPRLAADAFDGEGTVLSRYAGRLRAVEINSSFYRPHSRSTYERWAASTPEDFRFAVKAPRSITHEHRLVDVGDRMFSFHQQVQGLGDKLGVLLIQLPPSLTFDDAVATQFLASWCDMFDAPTACEPRHPSWFSDAADRRLIQAKVARVAADPALSPRAAEPGGFDGLAYFRLHGSPVMYASAYGDERLDALGASLAACRSGWCIFDNTKFGAATTDALALARRVDALKDQPRRSRSAHG